jgi:hypothetical protein
MKYAERSMSIPFYFLIAAIREERGEVLGHGGSCYVGDDNRIRKAKGRIKI